MMKTQTILSMIVLLIITLGGESVAQKMNKDLRNYSKEVIDEFDQIPAERVDMLKEIADAIYSEKNVDGKADILFICTHNSRRSHIAQLWLQTAMDYYGVQGVNVFSGGLEATAFNPNAISAMERAGFKISGVQSGGNPVYSASNGISNQIMYSKKYTDRQNPQTGFLAIMVCSDADKSCPIVEGADDRFSLPYDDPRYYDNTPSQDLKYDETVRKISREMFYLADQVKDKLILVSESKK